MFLVRDIEHVLENIISPALHRITGMTILIKSVDVFSTNLDQLL